MKNLNLKEKIAQMLLVGIPNKNSIDGVLELIKNNSIGGVILYKNNYSDLDELKNLITRLKDANKGNKHPLIIAIDQEGGRVNRLPREFNNSYSLNRMAKGSNDDISLYADATSKLLHDLGINMNFAPVLDLKMMKDSHAIGNRAISSDVNKVIEVSNLIVDSFKKNKVVSVIKHFPGQGSVKADSHFFLPIIKDYNEVAKKDLLTFINMIEKGIDAIMVGHIMIRKETSIYPATLSKKFINNELRDRLKYNNVVMTDEMGMRSVSYLYGKRMSIIRAFRANNDVICCKYSPRFIESIIDKVVKDIKKGRISEDSINNSIKRIINMKDSYEFSDNVNFDNIDIDKYNRIIDRIKSNIK